MKPNMNRLQTLLSMVKHITARPPRGDEEEREPWELATATMEQMELPFEGRSSSRRMDTPGEGSRG